MKMTFTEQTINNMSLDELTRYIDNGDIPCPPAVVARLRDCEGALEEISGLEDQLSDAYKEIEQLEEQVRELS